MQHGMTMQQAQANILSKEHNVLRAFWEENHLTGLEGALWPGRRWRVELEAVHWEAAQKEGQECNSPLAHSPHFKTKSRCPRIQSP